MRPDLTKNGCSQFDDCKKDEQPPNQASQSQMIKTNFPYEANLTLGGGWQITIWEKTQPHRKKNMETI